MLIFGSFDTISIHAHNLLENAMLHFILDQTLYKIHIIYKTIYNNNNNNDNNNNKQNLR